MKFSEMHQLNMDEGHDWFDPILNLDTALYVDPFLIYAQEFGPFEGSHAELIRYFEHTYGLVARSHGDVRSVMWKLAEHLLEFPEVDEFCLGVSRESVDGAGGGRGYAALIAKAMWSSIQAGLEAPTHFEEIQLFGDGIASDRISDAVGNVLKHRFAVYTESMCDALSIHCEPQELDNAVVDLARNTWLPQSYRLPINPFTNCPVLLIPKKFLRAMPTLNPQGFWRFCGVYHGDIIAAKFGYDIQANIAKEHIIELARSNPEFVREYSETLDNEEVEPYDLVSDRKGTYAWYDATKNAAIEHPVNLPNFRNDAEFSRFINELIQTFRLYVEDQRGWALLWNDDESAKPESASQDLFLGIVKHYCIANNVDVSREPNIGRGPVDFKLGQGQAFRALIEVKLAKNTRFWHGLKNQLPKYLEAEGIRKGVFLIIAQRDSDFRRLAEIQTEVADINTKAGYEISAVVIDARHSPVSASRLI